MIQLPLGFIGVRTETNNMSYEIVSFKATGMGSELLYVFIFFNIFFLQKFLI